FIGLAMFDPPRPEVKDAINACKNAGIKVVVATGDYGLTAKAIADEIGIRGDAKVVTGEELAYLSHGDLRGMLEKGAVIFARVTPKDKLRLVTALQDNGEVVAVTGDGVNDAPALKKADIGIAMGLRGSDAAKEAAEIVLMDDNFATIVEAVREGRAVYSNIKKFVTYIFASNIPEIVPFIAFVIFKIPLPLTVMQILAVDLGTDILPALGLGVEPPEKGIMDAPPRPMGKRLLDFKTLAVAYLFLGPIEAALSMSAFFFAYWARGWGIGVPLASTGEVYLAATTMSFAGIVASQIGNVFACRTERESVFTAGFFKNRFILGSLAAELALAIILIYLPFLERTFGFSPLTWKDWAFISAFPPVVLGAAELRKAFRRRRGA
ncbi:MAG TPA: HAD-IC family P-type ATPase, partial [Thermodesulfobacteriota bacterium]|nr:HAD-IC family P-type ATPase [Thermodesulfobacteriota bacterium]